MADPVNISFPCPVERPISINEISGKSWHAKSRDVDPWRDAAFYAWKQARTGPAGAVTGLRCLVRVIIPFRTNHKRDPSNYIPTVVKPIIDGIQLAGCWPDDTPEWVEVQEPKLKVFRNVPTQLPVVVILTPALQEDE